MNKISIFIFITGRQKRAAVEASKEHKRSTKNPDHLFRTNATLGNFSFFPLLNFFILFNFNFIILFIYFSFVSHSFTKTMVGRDREIHKTSLECDNVEFN